METLSPRLPVTCWVIYLDRVWLAMHLPTVEQFLTKNVTTPLYHTLPTHWMLP